MIHHRHPETRYLQQHQRTIHHLLHRHRQVIDDPQVRRRLRDRRWPRTSTPSGCRWRAPRRMREKKS